MDKPSYQPGTVLAVLDGTPAHRVVVMWVGPTGVPTVVPYTHWRPDLTKKNSLHHKVLHWAPRQSLELPNFNWKDSDGGIHTLRSSGWNVYGHCTAVCPDQQLPYPNPLPVKSERPHYPIGTILQIEETGGTLEIIWKWKVIGYTKKGTPRVMDLSMTSIDAIRKTLRWTNLGWKLGRYLIKISE
jgi:hypothetical protein